MIAAIADIKKTKSVLENVKPHPLASGWGFLAFGNCLNKACTKNKKVYLINLQLVDVKVKKLLLLLTLVFTACSNETDSSSEETSSEIEISYKPGDRTSKGGLVVSESILLDKNMNFAYLYLDEDKIQYPEDHPNHGSLRGDFFLNLENIVTAHFKDNFDFVAVIVQTKLRFNPQFYGGRCNVAGIGCSLVHEYEGRFKGWLLFPGSSNFDGFGGSVYLHEIAHFWGNFEVVPTTNPFHWGYSNVGGILGGYDTIAYLGNKTYKGSFKSNVFSSSPLSSTRYGNLERYLMGFIPPSELRPIQYAVNPQPLSQSNKNVFTADTIVTIEPEEFIAQFGERLPNYQNAQKDFRMLTLYVTGKNFEEAERTGLESKRLDSLHNIFTDVGVVENIENYDIFNFWSASGGQATIKTKISEDDIKIYLPNQN